jgi:hypothetical protein
MARCGRKPAPDTFRVLDAIDVLEQAQPRPLNYVSRVVLGEPEITRRRPQQPGKLIDKTLPR